ncbi:MAG: hypothetical protein P9X24_13645 [Candidatus Hatepunaea meridiana]|nr:hypothetical protein [Candidatus Hatepunaea meridiana]
MCNILTVIPNKDYVLKGEDALKANELSKYTFKDEIQWYLHQASFLNEDKAGADSLYNSLKSRGGKYASLAESQQARINTFIKRERFEDLVLTIFYFFIIGVLIIIWRR